MLDSFLYVGLPYIAIFSLVAGSIVRYKYRAFSYSSLSTQFLEDKWLAWASLPWHVGILLILSGHILAFGFPGLWSNFMSVPFFLFTVETIGVLSSFLCLLGLPILLTRRFINAKLQSVTSYLDIVVLLILFFQVISGLSIALTHRWGSAWAPGALGPYIHGIFTLNPDASFVTDMPPFIKFHITLAWILLAFFPFTRLVHIVSMPFHYFIRVPQKVVWNNSRSEVRFEEKIKHDDERRLFLNALIGTGAAGLLLSLGATDKFVRYFLKQDLSNAEEAHLLGEKLQHLKQSAKERELELERMKKSSIFVARVSELLEKKGKYFIDYHMLPALAFLSKEGFPILLSAKCTHLGCTVGQNVDNQGRILCPCHLSRFNIITGQPNKGDPAKDPLPHLGWVLKDPGGKTLLEQDQNGNRSEKINPSEIKTSMLFIVKKFS